MKKTWSDIEFLIRRVKAPYTVFQFANKAGWLIESRSGKILAESPEFAETVVKNWEMP